MTRTTLKTKTRDQLVTLAQRYRITGWKSLRKPELIDALLALPNRKSQTASQNGKSSRKATNGVKPHTNGKTNGNGRHHATNGANGKPASKNGVKHSKNGTNGHSPQKSISRILPAAQTNGSGRDHLQARLCDPHWAHVHWVVSPRTLQRAEVALGYEWHSTVPVVRVVRLAVEDSANSANAWIRDVEIEGDIDHWYIPLPRTAATYEFHLGYRSPSGSFFELARSKRVENSESHNAANNGDHWRNGASNGKNGSHAEGRLGRYAPQGSLNGGASRNGNGYHTLPCDFSVQVHTELIVHGATHPRAELTLMGERVKLERDGSFSLRLSLPNGRQVIPIVAVGPGGIEQRTIVLGIERNAKELEPQSLDESL